MLLLGGAERRGREAVGSIIFPGRVWPGQHGEHARIHRDGRSNNTEFRHPLQGSNAFIVTDEGEVRR